MPSPGHGMAIVHKELTTAVVLYLRPAQAQASQNSSMNRGGDLEAPSLTEELLAVGRCLGRRTHSSLSYATGRLPMPQGWPHTPCTYGSH